jgi:hypothetical protein
LDFLVFLSGEGIVWGFVGIVGKGRRKEEEGREREGYLMDGAQS